MHVSEKSAIENAKRRLIEARKEWAKSLQGEAFIAMQRRGEIEKHIGRLSGYPTVERMFETIGEFVGKTHRELGDRVTELEAKPVMLYRGVFDGETEYHRGDVVTSDGSHGSRSIRPRDPAPARVRISS